METIAIVALGVICGAFLLRKIIRERNRAAELRRDQQYFKRYDKEDS